MGLTVSYRHAWRRDLSSGLGLPFPIMMAHQPFHLERDFDCLRGGSCQLDRTSRSSVVFVLPFFSPYQHILISRQNHTGKILIHLLSPPDVMSLAGNCILFADISCDISLPDIMSLAGHWISYQGTFLWHIPAWHSVVGGELNFVCRSFLFCSGNFQILGGGRAIKGRRWWILMA